jgi:transcriptional regulator with XRE-family HTH domain
MRDSMLTHEAVAKRILQLCHEKGFKPNGIAVHSAVPQGTLKSILNGESKNPGIVTIKKLCDGFGLTLAQFFDTHEFNNLEQEIK